MSPTGPDLEAAAEALSQGRVVALPTDTVYGLAARAGDRGACAEIFRLKGRPEGLALPVLVGDLAQALSLASEEAAPLLQRLGERFWPGPLTLVVRRRPGLAFEIGGKPDDIGLRCPAEELVRSLCRRVGPLAATSANRHGEPPAESPAALRTAFGGQLGVIVGAGPRRGLPSTVVSLLGGVPELLRQGPVPLEAVRRALG